jgi:hypothetical protein
MKRVMTMLIPLLAGLALAGLATAALAKRTPPAAADLSSGPETTAVSADPYLAPAIRPSLRFSIPFGFASILPLRAGGQEVLVSGHGSCTEGETFTVAVTVTHQATGYAAHGDVAEACAGEAVLQTWGLTATAAGAALPRGAAETCGFAQTGDGETITDEKTWCVDVRLGDYAFLPMVAR